MPSDPESARLARDLVRLGRSQPGPTPAAVDELALRVTARLPDRPAPARTRWWTSPRPRTGRGSGGPLAPGGPLGPGGPGGPDGPARWWDAARRGRRRVLVAAAVVGLALLAAAPVRAAVLEWLRFGAAQVRLDPGGPAPTAPAAPPTVRPGFSLETARAAVGFRLWTPTALGRPDAVEVSDDLRRVSMSWAGPGGSPLRLDQFADGLDPAFAKLAGDVEFVRFRDGFALWFETPHEVVLLAPDGRPRTETARLAARTLIWTQGSTTLRLEGDLSREEAVRIAGSAR